MRVRHADIYDVEEASKLWLQMVAEMGPQYTPNVDWWKEIARGLFKQGTYIMLVAEEAGRLVGFVDSIIFPEPATGKMHGTCQHIYILPEYRNAAASIMLYRRIVRGLVGSGVKTIDLCCLHGDIPKWQKRGWQPARSLMRRNYV